MSASPHGGYHVPVPCDRCGRKRFLNATSPNLCTSCRAVAADDETVYEMDEQPPLWVRVGLVWRAAERLY